MDIYMAGIDHTVAEIKLRERFAFTRAAAAKAMQRISLQEGCGCVILSTCNRTEIWLGARTQRPAAEWLCALHGLNGGQYRQWISVRSGREAAKHLYATACGMNSRVFGEDQIITQVGEAAALSRACGCTDSLLERLFQGAVSAARRVKSTVRLTAVERSVATRAVEYANAKLGGLAQVPCLVIGNGEIGRLTARTLVKAGARVCVTLRQYKTGDVLVPAGCSAILYDGRLEALKQAQLIVSATTSPHHTLGYPEALPYLSGGRKLLLDLAVPRDIAPELGDLPGVALCDIDDLGMPLVKEHAQAWAQAEAILDEQLSLFEDWYYFRPLAHRIDAISAQTAQEVASRLKSSAMALLAQEEQQELLEQVHQAAERTVARLLYGLRGNLGRAYWEGSIGALEQSAQRFCTDSKGEEATL